jgi:hypothetical protein
MAFTIVVGTNSYVTRAEADARLEQGLGQALWFALSGVQRDQHLVEAFQLIERQRYRGTRTGGAAQLTQFPRDGVTSCDGYDESGVTPAPVAVKEAQVLLALELARDPGVATAAGVGSNVRRAKAGSAEVEFFASARNSAGLDAERFPTPVQELLRCYLARGGAATSEAFGTGAEYQCPDFGVGGNG